MNSWVRRSGSREPWSWRRTDGGGVVSYLEGAMGLEEGGDEVLDRGYLSWLLHSAPFELASEECKE